MSVSNLSDPGMTENPREGITLRSSEGNLTILFVTLALIVGILIFWIIISNTGSTQQLNIINGILASKIKPVTDAVAAP